MGNLSARIYFVGFALFLALRDILVEAWLQEEPIVLAFLVCLSITTIAALILYRQRGYSAFMDKLFQKGVKRRVFLLGLCAALAYASAFYMVTKVGAGLFNMIDYGLAPVATALLGFLFFKNKIGRDFIFSFLIYLIGLFMLTYHRSNFGFLWVLFLIISPVSSAISDALVKWLLDPKQGFNRFEVLILRFFPSTLFLFFYILYSEHLALNFHNFSGSIVVSVVGGFVPLYFLCCGLATGKLTELALWEFLIPALSFLATLSLHPETNARTMPLVGAGIILLSLLFSHFEIFSKIYEKLNFNAHDSQDKIPAK